MTHTCQICASSTEKIASIPFDVAQDGQNSPSLALKETPIDYFQCPSCGHVFAPWLIAQSKEWLSQHIYNADYPKYDADYLDAESGRVKNQQNALVYGYHFARKSIRHLDYGSGDGRLSSKLNAVGFRSESYDPFSSPCLPSGKFNLITAFEVIEHVPDPHGFIEALSGFMDDPCLIRIGTIPNDGEDIGSWWYANPRVGHLNMFSIRSMMTLAHKHRLSLSIVNGSDFFLWRNLPEWAKY